MDTQEKIKRRAKLKNQREKLEDKAVEKAVELEREERHRADLRRTLEDKRERREVLEGRDPESAAIIEKVEHELVLVEGRIDAVQKNLAQSHNEIGDIREREDELDDNIDDLTKRIKRLAKEIRADQVQPKVIDLGMSEGPTQPYINGSIGHYTAGPIARTDEEAVRLWWGVKAQHEAQGWITIGYNVGIGPEGGVYLLRGVNRIGAHTLGHNTGQVGFSVHGTTGDNWTDAQLAAFEWALKHFGLFDKPVTVHNDWMATACPGSFEPGYKSKGRSK